MKELWNVIQCWNIFVMILYMHTQKEGRFMILPVTSIQRQQYKLKNHFGQIKYLVHVINVHHSEHRVFHCNQVNCYWVVFDSYYNKYNNYYLICSKWLLHLLSVFNQNWFTIFHFTSTQNIFHGSLSLDQLYMTRPTYLNPIFATPGIRGLFLCGSGAHPGNYSAYISYHAC